MDYSLVFIHLLWKNDKLFFAAAFITLEMKNGIYFPADLGLLPWVIRSTSIFINLVSFKIVIKIMKNEPWANLPQ